MTAGKLAAVKPAATTNTTLYRCPTTVTGSTVVNVCNQSGSAATYRVALNDYDQVLHLSGPETENGGENASSFKFAKGNPISAYKIKLIPGYRYSEAIPGTEVTTTNAATFKILDVFRPTTDVTYYTIVEDVSPMVLETGTLAGTFQGGETVTGSVSGLTAVYRGGDDTEINLKFTEISNSATSIKISRNTGLADGMYLTLGPADNTPSAGEIASIDVGGIDTNNNTLTITRGVLGTTAQTIAAGTYANAWSSSATVTTIDEGATYAAGDQTLTVTDSTGFISGGFALIDNEIVGITDVNGNDLTVERGRYGTADVDHNNGVNVTLLTDNGVYLANYFSEGETLTGGTSNATADVDFDTATAADISAKYLATTTNGGTDHVVIDNPSLSIDRKYIWDLSDSTCANYPMKFSADTEEGPNSDPAGTEYTQGVSKVGTAGQSGAFTSIDVGENTPTSLFAYADGSPAGSTTGVGFTFAVNPDPSYEEIYIYDVAGEALAAADTFTVNNTTQTILANGVTPGPYGYVMGFDSAKAHLKVALSPGSENFAVNDVVYDTPTLNNGTRVEATVVDGKILSFNSVGAADSNRTEGTYDDITPSSTTGSGDLTTTKVKVVVDASGAATVSIQDGGKNHAVSDTIQINDALLGNGGAAALTFNVATISTGLVTTAPAIYDDAGYMFYDKALAANATDKNTALVVGPGENLTVYSSSADLSYVANGFESPSDDLTVINMGKVVQEGSGDPAP